MFCELDSALLNFGQGSDYGLAMTIQPDQKIIAAGYIYQGVTDDVTAARFLPDGTLDNSKAKLFRFSDAANCVQDIKVVFEDDGSEVVWEDIDLCELHKITLRYNRKTNVVSADTYSISVTGDGAVGFHRDQLGVTRPKTGAKDASHLYSFRLASAFTAATVMAEPPSRPSTITHGTGFATVSSNIGNFEGTFSASWNGGTITWLEDCHGDSYSVRPQGDAVYVVGHPHFCGNVGGFPQTGGDNSNLWTYHRALAFSRAATGTVAARPSPVVN